MPAETCPNCGWPQREPYDIVSTHRTSEGVVVYTRCACGALQMRLQRWAGGTRPIAEGRSPGAVGGRADPACCT